MITKPGPQQPAWQEAELGAPAGHELRTLNHARHHQPRDRIARIMLALPLCLPVFSKGWHTFGLLWTEDGYVFYVDGKETWRIKQAISKRPQYIVLSLEVGKWAGDIAKATLPDSLLVDYVRVYRQTAAAPSQTDGARTAPKQYQPQRKML